MRQSELRGFTMIELLVVLLIVIILAGMILPAINASSGRAHTKADAARVVSMLRKGKSRATSTGVIHALSFDLAADDDSDETTLVELFQVADINKLLAESPMPSGTSSWFTSTGDLTSSLAPALTPAGGVNVSYRSLVELNPEFTYYLFLPDGTIWGPGFTIPKSITVRPKFRYAYHTYEDEDTGVLMNEGNTWVISIRSLSGKVEMEHD